MKSKIISVSYWVFKLLNRLLKLHNRKTEGKVETIPSNLNKTKTNSSFKRNNTVNTHYENKVIFEIKKN
jgi:hypothetical protein